MSLYVVAGATGHIGSVVAHELAKRGEKVRAIVRSEAKGASLKTAGVELAVGSIDDAAFLTTALTGADGAFLLLPPEMTAPDVRAYQRRVVDVIAKAVEASGIKHVVFLSSLGAQHDSGTGPILGLHWAEQALAKTKAYITSMRAANFAENLLGMLPAAKGGGILPNFQREDFGSPVIATKDIGHAVVEELLHPAHKSEIVDVVGPTEHKPSDMAKALSEALGKPIQLMSVPAEGHVGAMQHAGFSQHVAELYAEMYHGLNLGKIVPGGAHRTVKGKTSLLEVLKNAIAPHA